MQAKEGAQETAVTLLGLLAGLACAGVLNSSPALQWAAFAVLTAVHVVANYLAVRTLALRTLNRSRSHALAWRFLHARRRGSASPTLPPPAEVALSDPVMPLPLISAFRRALSHVSPTTSRATWEPCPVRVGCTFPAALVRASSGRFVAVAITTSPGKGSWSLRELPAASLAPSDFADWAAAWGAIAGAGTDGCLVVFELGSDVPVAGPCAPPGAAELRGVRLVLLEGSTPQTQLCAYVAAVGAMQPRAAEAASTTGPAHTAGEGLLAALRDGVAAAPAFLAAAADSGWDVTLVQLGDEGVRVVVSAAPR